MSKIEKVELLLSNFTDNAIKHFLTLPMDETKGNKSLIESLTARIEQQGEKIVEMTKKGQLKERLSAQERYTSKNYTRAIKACLRISKTLKQIVPP